MRIVGPSSIVHRWLGSGLARLALILALLAGLAAPVSAATSPAEKQQKLIEQLKNLPQQFRVTADLLRQMAGPFKICGDQTYALCATAHCTMYNEVAYCKCDVKQGDSISLSFKLKDGSDVCDVNAAGADNGYMVSTYSVPEEVKRPSGDTALYTCPSSSTGAYAQCDGGICFKSSIGQSFPGFEKPLAKDEIICACPPSQLDVGAKIGYQIAGPYPCQQSHFRFCESKTASVKTGSTIYVGAPTGSADILGIKLNGKATPIYRCGRP